MLPGAIELTPLHQGSLSGLCGLYSMLNGIKLALYPHNPSRAEWQAIYLHGVGRLAQRRQLKRVLGLGMDIDTWFDLGTALLSFINSRYGTELVLQPALMGTAATDRLRAIQRIKARVESKAPVLTCLGRYLDHFTVICGYTPTRLMLFDSSGFQWVKAANVGIGEGSRRAHWIVAASTHALVDDW